MYNVRFISNPRIIIFNDDERIDLNVSDLPDVILKTIDYCVCNRETVLKAYIHLSHEANLVTVHVVTWDGIGVMRKEYQFDGDTGKLAHDWTITDSI